MQPITPLSDTYSFPHPQQPPSVKVLKLAAGPTHSAAISSQGLFTWGETFSGPSDKLNGWRPPDGALLVDVCCGRLFTVVADSMGRLFCEGAAEGKGPQKVLGLPDEVMWQRVRKLAE